MEYEVIACDAPSNYHPLLYLEADSAEEAACKARDLFGGNASEFAVTKFRSKHGWEHYERWKSGSLQNIKASEPSPEPCVTALFNLGGGAVIPAGNVR